MDGTLQGRSAGKGADCCLAAERMWLYKQHEHALVQKLTQAYLRLIWTVDQLTPQQALCRCLKAEHWLSGYLSSPWSAVASCNVVRHASFTPCPFLPPDL